MGNLDYRFFYRRHLPHFQPPGATLFVTFRLVGSIPQAILRELVAERQRVEAILDRIADPVERERRAYLEERRLFGKWDDALDTAQQGPFWLRDPRVAALVDESLHHRHDGVYTLDAFCIMPNHVHLVCTPLPKPDGTYHALAAVLHSLKLYTAIHSNELLGRKGQFWQHESYDHVVRDEEELRRIIAYVMNNPVKAGLVATWEEWPWTYVRSFSNG